MEQPLMHPGTKMTPMAIAQMLGWLADGESYRQVARRHSIDHARVHRLHRRVKRKGRIGLEQPRSRPHSSPTAILPQDRRRAVAMRAQGMPATDIARALNCHISTIYRILGASRRIQKAA